MAKLGERFTGEEVLCELEVTEKSNRLQTEKRSAILAIRRFGGT